MIYVYERIYIKNRTMNTINRPCRNMIIKVLLPLEKKGINEKDS